MNQSQSRQITTMLSAYVGATAAATNVTPQEVWTLAVKEGMKAAGLEAISRRRARGHLRAWRAELPVTGHPRTARPGRHRVDSDDAAAPSPHHPLQRPDEEAR